MSTETRLKPCPFCGGAAKEFERFNANVITCRRCGVKVRQSEMGEGDAAERWNQRATPVAAQPDVTQQTLDDVMAGIPARDAEIEALRKEIEALQAAPVKPYSLDLDPAGIRALTADAISGALALGFQGVNQPPNNEHWLAPFWEIGRESAAQVRQPVSGADDIEFLVRVLEQVSAWLPEDWSEFLERNPAVVDMLRPMVNHQTQQDADKVDAALAEMVHAMFRSGNSVPVTRITIDRKQYDAAIDAARKEVQS